MEDFCNAQTFLKNVNNCYDEEILKLLDELIKFTSLSKSDRESSSFEYFDTYEAFYNDSEYFFNYNGKKYSFAVFSDWDLQEFDKRILESGEGDKWALIRSLKLACSMDLVNPKIVVGSSLSETYSLLILLSENGDEKVIDYSKNIIMNKKDYYEVFSYQEFNIIDKSDLYNIYFILDLLQDSSHIYEYLLFTKQIFSELAKMDCFSFLMEKYDRDGLNNHNNVLLGNASDCLFFINDDFGKMQYSDLQYELDEFTKRPVGDTEHISYNCDLGVYELREKSFGFFTFKLLSDIVCDQGLRDELLSDSRYHKCHSNAVLVARFLSSEDKSSAYVVGGKFRENECDYLYHSWVEVDSKNIVIDFNHNVIMNRDKYYKLFEAKPISKTLIDEIDDSIKFVESTQLFDFHIFMVNYFGKEIVSDLKRNAKILSK